MAYTRVDEPLLPPDIHVTSEIHVTSDITYLRWHGRGTKPWFNYRYSEEQLAEWVPRVNEAAGLRMFGHTACIGSVALDGTLAGFDT